MWKMLAWSVCSKIAWTNGNTVIAVDKLNLERVKKWSQQYLTKDTKQMASLFDITCI